MKERFEIKYTPLFLRRIGNLNRENQVRILREIKTLEANPYAGKPLCGEWKGIFFLRVGDYRILYQIKGTNCFC